MVQILGVGLDVFTLLEQREHLPPSFALILLYGRHPNCSELVDIGVLSKQRVVHSPRLLVVDLDLGQRPVLDLLVAANQYRRELVFELATDSKSHVFEALVRFIEEFGVVLVDSLLGDACN